MFRVIIRWIHLLAFFAGCGSVSAHTGFESETDVRIYADRVDIICRTTFAFGWKLLGERAPADVGEEGQAVAGPLLAEKAPGLFEVTAAGNVLKPTKVDCQFELDQHVVFLLTYDRPSAWPMVLRARFFDFLDPLSDGKIKVFDQTDDPDRRDIEPFAGKIIYRADPVFSFNPSPAVIRAVESSEAAAAPRQERPNTPGFGGYFKLGFHHISRGYDHLLFLLALLLGCRSLKAMVIIVTAFTVAHSLTLALAALGWVDLPERWVESFIALSIVWVGVGNLLGKTAEKSRGWLTFGFGLVHGLGFASVLKGIGLGAGGQSIVPPLLAFNLGVETGQLAIVFIALPVRVMLRKQTSISRCGVPALSALVALAGLVWFFQRVSG